MDEYAMCEARYLNMDSEGRMALERCIVDIYKAVLTYAAEMKYYIHHRLGISFRSFEEKDANANRSNLEGDTSTLRIFICRAEECHREASGCA
jgi:hypothetical protein